MTRDPRIALVLGGILIGGAIFGRPYDVSNVLVLAPAIVCLVGGWIGFNRR